MTDRLEQKIVDFIEADRLLEGVRRLLLAVSGGADSVAMAHVLRRLVGRGRLRCELVIGHVNHGLRGADADTDEAFVKALAQRLGTAVVTTAVPVRRYAAEHKLSIETAGRRLRLEALGAMARAEHCQAIATAHHADDQAETLVHRLMRGTGFRGLCGIRPISAAYGGRFIRPLLDVRRADIERYCVEQGLGWRHDLSNTHLAFTRNRIRHRLLPELATEGDVTEPLAHLAAAARRLQARIDTAADAVERMSMRDGGLSAVTFDREKLRPCPPWVFYELLRRSVVSLGAGLRDYTQAHVEAVRKMLEQPSGRADLPGRIEVRVEPERVVLRTRQKTPPAPLNPVELAVGQTVRFGQWTISARLLECREVDVPDFLRTKDAFVEWFDADQVVGPMTVRPRRNGDRFWPIGAGGEKKVGRFLLDAGLDADTRGGAFIVTDTEKILWLAPIRMAEPPKVTDRTQRILELSIS